MNTNLTFSRICAEMSLRPGKTMPRQLQDPGRQLRDLVPIGICLLIEPASGNRPLSGLLQAQCNPRPAKEYPLLHSLPPSLCLLLCLPLCLSLSYLSLLSLTIHPSLSIYFKFYLYMHTYIVREGEKENVRGQKNREMLYVYIHNK